MRFSQSYTGRSRYLRRHESGPHLLIVAVACYLGERQVREIALLDTAAEWCVLTPGLAKDLGVDAPGAGWVRLSTRFGNFDGWLERIPLTLTTDSGVPTTVEATWFVCEDWPGPLVIGWTGGLERLRFALDPAEDTFYFGELHEPGS